MPKQQIGEKNAPAAAAIIGIVLIIGSGYADTYSLAVTIIGGAMVAVGGFGLLQRA